MHESVEADVEKYAAKKVVLSVFRLGHIVKHEEVIEKVVRVLNATASKAKEAVKVVKEAKITVAEAKAARTTIAATTQQQ